MALDLDRMRTQAEGNPNEVIGVTRRWLAEALRRIERGDAAIAMCAHNEVVAGVCADLAGAGA